LFLHIFLLPLRISGFEELIRSGLHFLDLTVEGIVDTIMITLRRLVEENILNPLDPWISLDGLELWFSILIPNGEPKNATVEWRIRSS
jgi:hypothetical protein